MYPQKIPWFFPQHESTLKILIPTKKKTCPPAGGVAVLPANGNL